LVAILFYACPSISVFDNNIVNNLKKYAFGKFLRPRGFPTELDDVAMAAFLHE
jgi:hypothetical protein